MRACVRACVGACIIIFEQSCGLVHPYLYIADDKCVLPVERTAEGGNEFQVVKLPSPPLQVRTFEAQKVVKAIVHDIETTGFADEGRLSINYNCFSVHCSL